MREITIKKSSGSAPSGATRCRCYCMWTMVFDADNAGTLQGACGCACPENQSYQMGALVAG